MQFFFTKALCQTLSNAFDISQNIIIDDNLNIFGIFKRSLETVFSFVRDLFYKQEDLVLTLIDIGIMLDNLDI